VVKSRESASAWRESLDDVSIDVRHRSRPPSWKR
jgi:hypothetical protein